MMESVMSARPAGIFITQRGEKHDHFKDGHNIAELEAMVSGITQTTQATLLLKKKKEMREVDDALAFVKEKYKERMGACEIRQKEFERNQESMRAQVLKFEKFIQENDAKRHRAEQKSKHERKLFEQKEKELVELEQMLKQTEQERHKLMQELGRLKKYKDYLERTVDQQNDQSYEEVLDLLNRHKVLVDLYRDRKQFDLETERATDRIRLALQLMQVETQNQLLVQGSQFYAEQSHLEQLRSMVKKDAERRDQQESRAQDAQRDTGEVVIAIKNLYNRCLQTAGRTSIARLKDKDCDLMGQLDFYLRVIQDRLIDLTEVAREYEKQRE